MEDLSVEAAVETLKNKNLHIFRYHETAINGDFDSIQYMQDDMVGTTIIFSESFTLTKIDMMWLAGSFLGQGRVYLASSPSLFEVVNAIYFYSLMRKQHGDAQARSFSRELKHLLVALHEGGFVTEIISPHQIAVLPIKPQTEPLTSFRVMLRRMDITRNSYKFIIDTLKT